MYKYKSKNDALIGKVAKKTIHTQISSNKSLLKTNHNKSTSSMTNLLQPSKSNLQTHQNSINAIYNSINKTKSNPKSIKKTNKKKSLNCFHNVSITGYQQSSTHNVSKN